MLRFGSLRTRLVVFTTIPLLTILLATLWLTLRTGGNAVRTSVNKSLNESGGAFVQMLSARQDELVGATQVIARDPRFFATLSIPESDRGEEFAPTLVGVASDFLRITDADFMDICTPDGAFIVSVNRGGNRDAGHAVNVGREAVSRAHSGGVITDYFDTGEHLVAAAIAPVYVAQNLEAILRIGRVIDDRFTREFKRRTGSDVAILHGGTTRASTFPDDAMDWPGSQANEIALTGSTLLSEAFNLERGRNEYLAVRLSVDGVDNTGGFTAYIAHDLHAALLPVMRMERNVAIGGLLAVLVLLYIAFVVANSITRPLSNIVAASTALERGRYDYPVDVQGTDEVARLGENFVKMRDSLEQYVRHLKNLDQAKSNFIALAGHELRTPLTVISGFNELIASGALGDIPDNVRETAQVINDQLTSLNRLVRSMLDLTSFEQGLQSLSRESMQVTGILANVAKEREEAIAARQLKLTVNASSEELIIVGDRIRISDAVLQLLDNAIRFTPDGGSVTLSASGTESHVRIVVADTGMGIAPNELKWIFEKIYEVGDILNHSSGRHSFGSRGFGLGLALCRAIVDAHGGTIHVDSTPMRGSRFTIELPRVELPLRQPAKAELEGALT